jgi:1,4-alpha-glucan branching enzyme
MRTDIKIEPSHGIDLRKVQVTVNHADAREISIAGTFNNWEPSRTPLKPVDDDWWVAELMLPPGDHEYRYVVDGKWVCDPRSPKQVPNPYGSYNSVIIVPPAGKRKKSASAVR